MRGLALSGRGSRVALATAVLIFGSASFSAIQAWGACTYIPAPCQVAPVQAPGTSSSQATPTPQSSLSWQRTCTAYFNGAPAIPPTLTRPVPIPSYTGIVQQIQTQVQKDANCYYQGVDPNPFVPNPGNPSCPGNPNWGTACSLVPNPLNSNSPAELSQNYRGASCGDFMTIHSHMNDSGCPKDTSSTTSATPPADVAAALLALPNHPSIFDIMKMNSTQLQALYQQLVASNPSLANSIGQSSSGKSICMYMSSGATEGERERSWLRGAFIQALSYYETQVIQEITTSHQIQIPSNSPCQAMAQDQASFQKSQIEPSFNKISGFVTGMSNGSQKNIADIVNCTADWSTVRLPDGTLDRGQLRQSAQNLCAARTGLESAFTELAVCEIFERTQSDYDAKTGIPNVQPLLIDAEQHIESAPYGSSGQGCRHECMNKGSWGSFDRCANNCYRNNLPLYWTKKFSNWWPTSGSSPFSCMGISLLFPPCAVGERKRRGKRKSKLAKRIARLVLTLIAAFALIWLTGCSDNSNIPAVPVPAPSAGCSSGSSCGNVGAGTIEGAQVGAGSALAGATQAGGSAASLIGNASGLSTMAAKGPGTPSGVSPSNTSGASGGGSMMGMPQIASAAPGGSGSGPLGSGSASGSDNPFGYGQDGSGAAGPTAQAGPTNNGDSYSGGGGPGGGGSNSTDGLLGWGGGGDGALSGANGENAFGRDIPPMASRDPANYFTMIDPSDSLFRKVTARYQQTAMQWASSNTMNAGPSSDIHGGVISVPARK